MKRISFVVVLFIGSLSQCFSQDTPQLEAPPDYVLEVKQSEGVPLSFQKFEQASVYGGFRFLPGWPKANVPAVTAIRIRPRMEDGQIRVKVTAIRDEAWETDDLVADYALSEKTITIDELKNFGIVPFEIRLVRAPPSVADLPTVVNKTRSLVVSVEPTTGTLPSFKIRILNSSGKAVFGYRSNTVLDGRKRFIAAPRGRRGTNLIEAGVVFEATLPYPTQLVHESIGELPNAKKGAEFQLLAVVFADGTFEGDAGAASQLRASQLGQKVQLSRILELLHSDVRTDPALLAEKTEALPSTVSDSDMAVLLRTFPRLSKDEIGLAHATAEADSADIQRDFKRNFGKGSKIPAEKFDDAVKAATMVCEKVIASLP
jgi:hypothetical protein